MAYTSKSQTSRLQRQETLLPALSTRIMSELAVLAVVVVDEELGLFFETPVANLLLHPLDRRRLGDVEMDNISTRQFHDDKNVEDPKTNGMLHEEIAGPDNFGLVLQEGLPRL